MAHKDYTRTPLSKKLGIREGSRVFVSRAPEGFELGPLPSRTTIARGTRVRLDVVLLFATRRGGLDHAFAKLAAALDPAGRLWVAWPKKAAAEKAATDLTFEIVQKIGLDAGLVDNKSASIDEVYQGLQFVYRLEDRPKG